MKKSRTKRTHKKNDPSHGTRVSESGFAKSGGQVRADGHSAGVPRHRNTAAESEIEDNEFDPLSERTENTVPHYGAYPTYEEQSGGGAPDGYHDEPPPVSAEQSYRTRTARVGLELFF